jgi:hypothetical protein
MEAVNQIKKLQVIRFTIVILLLPIALLCQTPKTDQKKYLELESEIVKILERTNVVGVSVAIVSNYEVAWAKGFGLTEAGSTCMTQQLLESYE